METKKQMVSFRLNNEYYCIEIDDVREVIRFTEAIPIPNCPKFVEGVINLRGKIIPIVDLKKRFNLSLSELNQNEPEDDEENFHRGILIIQLTNIMLGIIIDQVSRVVTVEGNTIQPPPHMISGIGIEYIGGVINQTDGLLTILNIQKLFSNEELKQLESVNQ